MLIGYCSKTSTCINNRPICEFISSGQADQSGQLMQRVSETVSDDFHSLEASAWLWFLQKIALSNTIDLKTWAKKNFPYQLQNYPSVEVADMSNYQVLQSSFYTAKQMKVWKSREAYNCFISNWVKDLALKSLYFGCFVWVFEMVAKTLKVQTNHNHLILKPHPSGC